MAIADLIIPEFDREMSSTRRVLERVPDQNGAWRPHEKSFPIGHLAQHVSRLPSWATMIMTQTQVDLDPPGGRQFPDYTYEKTTTLLETFDENVAKGHAAIGQALDSSFKEPWALKRRGITLVSMSRYDMLRTMMMNHIIHHRAQLTVYLRLLNIPLPGLYGPTADERM
jgi:uncharacterized damage-inducible protein DinB